MEIKIENGVAEIQSASVLITDVQSALDLMATVSFEHKCNSMVIPKECICEDFFDLKTKLAGDILQKFTNYNFNVTIVGDFSVYTSKSLKDFMYESNKGTQVRFVSSENQ